MLHFFEVAGGDAVWGCKTHFTRSAVLSGFEYCLVMSPLV
jgi:hypothetical protein